MKKILLCLTLLFPITTLHANNADLITKFETHVDKTFKQWNIPGAAVAVVSKDKVIFMKSYGVRSIKTKQPVNEHTVFRIASISKGFTAELTGLIMEQDFLQWDDKVIKYLPDFKLHDPKATQALTIRDLLSQRTGLPERTYDNLIDEKKPYNEVIYSLYKVPLTCPVGTCYAYQNVTFSMVGTILEKPTHKTYTELLTENIFKPLNMQDVSTTYAELIATDNYADCHELTATGVFTICSMTEFAYTLLPAGGINASLNDLIIWLRAQMGAYPNIISPKLLKAVQTPQITIPAKDLAKPYAPWQKDRLQNASYGMGWRIDNYAGNPMIFHSGALDGVTTVLGFLPEHEIGIIVLANTHNYSASILMAEFFDLYLNIPPKDWNTPLIEMQKAELKKTAENK